MKQTAVEKLQELNEQVDLNEEDFKVAIEYEIEQTQSACEEVYNKYVKNGISDEEIKKQAVNLCYSDLIISIDSFIAGAKWYREQLKNK